MSVNMDVKSDDVLSIDIDSVILSYGLGQLHLDDPNDIFEFPEETPKNCDNVDAGNDFPSENEVEKPDLRDKCKEELSTENKTCNDINGNEDVSSSENLNQLFDKLELSDSNNDKLKGFNSGNCKVELPDTYEDKVELSESYNEKVELSDSCNKNFEILCKDKSKLSVSDNSKTELSNYGNIKVEQFHSDNGKTELSNYDNIKVEQFDSDNGKTELSNYDNIKVEQFDSDNGKTELSNFDIKVELFDSDNDVKGELSDSDNEANEDCLTERGGAIKNKSRKHRDQSNNYSRNRKSVDKSQINPQILNNWTGSRLIKSSEPNYVDQYAFQLDLTSIYTGYENTIPTCSRQDYFYEDARAKAVNSPESGYESSSALSGSSSPPLLPLYTSNSLDLIPETVDDQNIVELLVEVDRDGALTDHKLATCDSDGKQGKINRIIDYLKGIRSDLWESCNEPTSDYLKEILSDLRGSCNEPTSDYLKEILSDLRESCNEPSNYLQDISSDLCESFNELTSNYLNDIPSDVCESFNEPTSNYLKDIPSDVHESCIETTSNNIQGCVPLVNSTPEFSIQPVPLLRNIPSKNVETPKHLAFKLKDKAKRALQEFLSVDELYAAQKRIYSRIWQIKKVEDVKVIYVEDQDDKASENRTNLHYAVLESRIEDIYCLVEIQKQYKKPLADINIRDKYGRTALDYAIKKDMTLVVEYLKENTACKSVNI